MQNENVKDKLRTEFQLRKKKYVHYDSRWKHECGDILKEDDINASPVYLCTPPLNIQGTIG